MNMFALNDIELLHSQIYSVQFLTNYIIFISFVPRFDETCLFCAIFTFLEKKKKMMKEQNKYNTFADFPTGSVEVSCRILVFI